MQQVKFMSSALLRLRSLPEAIMPHSRRTDKVCIIPQRRERELRLLGGDEAATAANHFADTIDKKRRALHHAATQHDSVRGKQIDQIGWPQAQVESLMFDRL